MLISSLQNYFMGRSKFAKSLLSKILGVLQLNSAFSAGLFTGNGVREHTLVFVFSQVDQVCLVYASSVVTVTVAV